MAIVSRSELREMVNHMVPRTRKEPAPPDTSKTQEIKQTLREQAAEQIRRLGQ